MRSADSGPDLGIKESPSWWRAPEQLRRRVDRFSAGAESHFHPDSRLAKASSTMEHAGNNPTVSVQDHNYTYMFNFEQVGLDA